MRPDQLDLLEAIDEERGLEEWMLSLPIPPWADVGDPNTTTVRDLATRAEEPHADRDTNRNDHQSKEPNG